MGSEPGTMREALKRVATTLKQADVPFALSGGYASWARGGPEPDHDVDFVVLESDVQRAVKALTDAGLRPEDPPEDWLVKVYDGDVLIDLIFRPAERPVTAEHLARSEEMSVDSVVMPVQSATDLLLGKMLVFSEHYCDFSKVLPHARALREQVDWQRVRQEVDGSPFARAFLKLVEELGIVPEGTAGAAA